MADYYELLGVDADAPVDDIRAAYRDKKAAVSDAGTDAAKADAAALNKAWNVLSDPYQRGRYDEQRASGGGATETDDGDDDDVEVVPARRSRSKADARAKTNARRAPLEPTVKLPAGTAFPAPKQRFLAMGIDVVVLIVLFMVSQVAILPKLEKSQHPAAYQAATDLNNKLIPDAKKVTSAAKKKQSAADKAYQALVKSKGANASDTQTAKAADDAAKQAVTDAQKAEKKLTDDFDAQSKILAPLQRLVSGLFFLVALLVLFVPSLFGGATIGKRSQRVRVIAVDGGPATALHLFRRYTALVFAAYALSFVLGPVGALVVVFVATMWTRNPNQQGLQDRFARTLVVTDES